MAVPTQYLFQTQPDPALRKNIEGLTKVPLTTLNLINPQQILTIFEDVLPPDDLINLNDFMAGYGYYPV